MSTIRDLKDKQHGQQERGQAVSSNFSVEEISQLLEMLRENGVSEFSLERGGEKLMLKRGAGEVAVAPLPVIQYAPAPAAQSVVSGSEAQSAESRQAPALAVVEDAAKRSSLLEVKSPMVGTFYRKPAVDAPPYVQVGSIVKKGDVLCIVEAMKLMNEIESEVSGRVTEICLQDGQMVEYGEVLFRIDPIA